MMNLPAPLTPFREEILASMVVLGLVTSGSFFAVSRLFDVNTNSNDQQSVEEINRVLESLTPEHEKPGKVLGEGETEEITQQSELKPESDMEVSPTIDPFESEVFYGKGGFYDYEEYKLQLDSPRIGFNLKDPGKRKFLVDFVLTNKNVSGGLPNQVFASIIKDGNIIVPKTALSVKDSIVLKPGESIKFTGSIALIEATDVKEILFEPMGDIPKIVHPLKQD